MTNILRRNLVTDQPGPSIPVLYAHGFGCKQEVTSARVAGQSAVLQTDQAVEGRDKPFFKMLMFNGHYIPSSPRSLEEKA